VSVAATVAQELGNPLGIVRRTITVNAECGMRYAERATAEPPHSQFRIHNSAFVVAFGRAALTLTSMLALPAATDGVKAAEREVAVDVLTVKPLTVTGRLVSFSLRDGAIVQTFEEKRQIPIVDIIRVSSTTRESWSEVVGVRHVTTPQDAAVEAAGLRDRAAQTGEQWTITFTWGDVLCGRVIGARGETVVMETADLGEIPIPIDAVARIAPTRAAAGFLHRESLHWLDRWSAESRRAGMSRSASSTNALKRWGDESVRTASETEDDRVLLTNGDVLRGFISAIDADGIAIDTGTGPTTAPFRLVVAARLAHAVPPVTPQPYAIVTLRDGSRLTVSGLDWGNVGVEVKLRTGTMIHIDADRVVAVDVIGGRWEWLSDTNSPNALERLGDEAVRTAGRHRPVSYEQSPMLGPGWEYLAGRNVLSGPILVGGVPYERGIGVHSRSNLVFELNGEYREFVTSFGMDDDSGPLADVTVVILVDGQRRFEKAHVRRGTLFGPVRVDVAHAGRIELIVEYGDNGDMQDRFDWVESGLIK